MTHICVLCARPITATDDALVLNKDCTPINRDPVRLEQHPLYAHRICAETKAFHPLDNFA